MDFIFDDDDTTVLRLVNNQLIGRLKLDIVTIALELGHQIGAPLDNARPTGEVVEDLVDDVVSDDVEEVLAIDEVAERASNQIEVRVDGLIVSVFQIRHPGLSMRRARLLTKGALHVYWKLASKKAL
jgi:hypothetical protein